MKKILTFPLLLFLISACSHPLEIVGEGDIVSSTGTRDCTWESQPCQNFAVTGDYNVTYSASPRDGWSFVGWQNCGTQNPQCTFNFPAATVLKFWFKTVAPLRAIFSENGAGIAVGAVQGNTLELGSIAQFPVKLKTAPLSTVTFSISSSDESEGIPEVSEFTFTPSNWNQAQTVAVRGANGALNNGSQGYQIVFGPTMSTDLAYDNLSTLPVEMQGLSLDIIAPAQPLSLLANAIMQIGTEVQYTGYAALTYGLTSFPTGMTIDPVSGLLVWTPQASDEGQIFAVTVTATDGLVSDVESFEITVLQPAPLAANNTATSLIIDTPDSNLNGLSIAATSATPQTDFTQLAPQVIPIQDAPDLPAWVTPLSDVLVLPDAVEEGIEVRFPVSNLPIGITLDKVNIYLHADTNHGTGKTWVPVSLDYHFEGTAQNPIYVASLSRISGMVMLGYHQTSSAVRPTISVSQRFLSTFSLVPRAYAQTVSCVPSVPGDYSVIHCSSGTGMDVTLLDFGQGTRWGGVTAETVVGWLRDAQAAMAQLPAGQPGANLLNPDLSLSVRIEPMTEKRGYVSQADNYQILHLSDDHALSSESIQATVAHEYFHNGQAKTSVPGKVPLIDLSPENRWMIEGSARWFEDVVYDGLNSYQFEDEATFYPIFEKGLAFASFSDGVGAENPYLRFTFFKLLSEHCLFNNPPTFNNIRLFDVLYKDFVNTEASDTSGIQGFINNFLGLSYAGGSCNFGSNYINNVVVSGYEAAFLKAVIYYQYATLLERDMSLLDPNETGVSPSSFQRTNYVFSEGTNEWLDTVGEWLARSSTEPYTLKGVSSIPAYGAVSFTVPAISGASAPGNERGRLTVNADGKVYVSMLGNWSGTSNTGELGGRRADTFATDVTSSYTYHSPTGVPELFVTLVNTSDTARNVSVGFEVVEVGEPISETIIVDGKEWALPNLFTNNSSLSWSNFAAVCPSGGVCAGTLNGLDLTGWTWADRQTVHNLFNFYIGSSVLGPNLGIYEELPAPPTSGWAVSFMLNGGWSEGVTVGGVGQNFASIYGWTSDPLVDGSASICFISLRSLFGGGTDQAGSLLEGDSGDPGAWATGVWLYRTAP